MGDVTEQLCCLDCQLVGIPAVGDRAWAKQHHRETGHTRFAGAAELRAGLTGTVRLVNPTRGFAAIDVNAYGFIVVEVLGPFEFEIGDIVTGMVRRHGTGTVRLERQQRDVRVFVQAYDATPANARVLVKGA